MMETPAPIGHTHEDELTEQTIQYPPKFEKKERSVVNVWMQSIISLALYLILGYYIFPSYTMLLLVTAIVVIHEMGHFLAMKAYKYSDLGIFFIPLLGAYVSGTKREVSQKQSAVILLAGPLPGIIIGIVFLLLDRTAPNQFLFNDYSLPYDHIGLLFIFLNLINLLPVYPLDGGQLLNRVFLDEESWIGKGFVFLSAAFLCWIAWKLNFWVLLIFPFMMLLRLRTDKQFDETEKKIEAAGINIDVAYDDLRDEDYWKVRNILIESHSAFKDIPPSPPYEYDAKEDKIMSTIRSLLHRHIIQDIGIAGKILIVVLWVLAFASPWLINVDLSFFRRFGF
jgi:Zn-dependent protease